METIPFVGRYDFLGELHIHYDSKKVIMVHGLKSIGKTRTISEYLNRRRTGVYILEEIQINLTEKNIVETIFIRLSTILRLQLPKRFNLEEIIIPLINVFNKSKEVEFVLIIDNCEYMFQGSGRLWNSFKQFCCELYQTCENVHVITITSFLPGNLGDFFPIELKPLSLSESCMLLKQFLPDRENGLVKVAELCHGLPLALIMTGAEFADNNLEHITEILQYSRIQALSLEFYPAKDRLDFNYGPLVMRLAPSLREYLAALQYIPGSFSQVEALQIIGHDVNSSDLEAQLTNLQQHHIITKETKHQQRFNIHSILRDCIEMFLVIKDIHALRRRFCKTFAAVMRVVSLLMNKTKYVEAIEMFSIEYPNIQKLLLEVNFATNDTFSVFIELVNTSADFLHDYMGGESLPFYKQCLLLIPSYGTRMDEAILKWGIGEVLTDDKGKFSEGEERYRNALDLISDQSLSLLHVRVRSSLGLCLFRLGKTLASIRELQHALEEATCLGMRNEPIMTTCIRRFATAQTYYNERDGEMYHKEALERAIKYHGSEYNAEVAKSYNGLGLIFQCREKHDSALEYFEKAFKVKKKCKMAPKSLILSMNNIALRYSLIDRKNEACELLQEALIMIHREKGEHMVSRLSTLENLARIQLRMHNYEAALGYIDEVISIRIIHSPLIKDFF